MNTPVRKNNRSGVPGIAIIERASGKSIRVSWVDEYGTNKRTEFSVRKHGALSAVRMAIERREEMGYRVGSPRAVWKKLQGSMS